MSEPLACQFCGKPFVGGTLTRGAKTDRSLLLQHADHELKCPDNPDRPVAGKASSAWTPAPWKPDMTSAATPKPERVTYLGGPWHGRSQAFDAYLVDGTRLEVEPPKIVPGPQMADSKGRSCSKFMGHYELRLKGGCPIYRWVETITPKRRLPSPRTFTEAWPELAAQLQEEAAHDGAADELQGDLPSAEPGGLVTGAA